MARRRLLVIVEGRHYLGLRVKQALAFRILCDISLGLEFFGADLERNGRMSLKVVVPGRMRREAAFRRDNYDTVAVLGVHQRRGEGLAALRTGGRQQQQRRVDEGAADSFAAVGAKFLDQAFIELLHRFFVELGHGGLLTALSWEYARPSADPSLDLGPLVVPWARLLVRVRRLQHQVFAVTLGDDLQAAWQTRIRQACAHRRRRMPAHVERIGEDDSVERML